MREERVAEPDSDAVDLGADGFGFEGQALPLVGEEPLFFAG